jgi:trk system potassium uptake protein
VAKHAKELRYAVRPRVVLKYLGQLCLVLAILTLIPLAMSAVFDDLNLLTRYAIVSAGLAALGAGLGRLRTPSRVQANEGMVVVALMLFLTPLVMSYPMMGSGLAFEDAFFEAVSGVTTTGLSTKATLADATPIFLFGRAWMQWYGGLGIVILSLAFVIQPGQVAKGLAGTETETDDLIGGTKAHTRRVLIVYGILTVLGILGTVFTGNGFFDSILYTFAALSTGGFAPHNESLAIVQWPGQVWITLLCLAGAVPLMFYYHLLKEKRIVTVAFLQLQVIILASLVISVTVAISMRVHVGIEWSQAFRHALLLTFSAQTTAGFSSMECSQLDAASKLLLMFSMLVGGGAGSTAGGIKVLRLLIAASAFRLLILRTCLPQHAVLEPRLTGRRMQHGEVDASLLLIVLFIIVVLTSWLPFVAMGYAPLDSLFEVVSATGTVGLSVGLSSSTLPPLLKGVLCVDMLLGRLEIIAWLVMIYPGTWFGRRMEEK